LIIGSPFIHFLVQDVIELPRPVSVKRLVWTNLAKGLDQFAAVPRSERISPVTAVKQKTTRDLRWHNRSDLLSRLYLREAVSRNDLVRASGLSAATISNVVSDLINDGLVTEAGSESSAGGRPRSLLRVRPDFGHVVGVDIAETQVRVSLFDWTLAPVEEEVRPILADRWGPELVASQVLAGIEAVSARSGIAAADLLGVGIGVPGAVQTDPLAPGQRLVHAPTLGWSGVPLADLVERGLGYAVDIDNGAMALGQAETWHGAARGAERAVTLLLGIGAGGALTMAAAPGGRARSVTIEWGHTVVDVNGLPCRCGSRGCLETYIGAEAILRRHQEDPESEPLPADDVETRLAALVSRAGAGDPAATRTLDVATSYLGIGISNLINLLAPDCVVLSGWAGAVLGPALLPGIRKTAGRHALPYLHSRTRIEQGELGPAAATLGAATLPVARLLAGGGR
jgi:predicted NBD/HSP70 family sugar kinase